MTYLNDLLHRLRLSLFWIAAQFWAMLLLVLAGIAFTRLPDKYAWQVFLSLLAPVLLIAAFLFLQASTMRSLLPGEPQRKPLWQGALMLLAWAVAVWATWAILDWCIDQIPMWAGYLNSRAPAPWRDSLFTYQHLSRWLTLTVWLVRWIIVPGKVIPYAMASAVSGWRLPVTRVLRVLWNWCWWPVVVLAALASVALSEHFFTGLPHGTVRLQVSLLALKLAGSYLLVILGWVLVLAWAAVLLAHQPQPAEDAFDQRIISRLHQSRFWIAALAGWILLSALMDFVAAHLFGISWVQNGFGILEAIIMVSSIVIILAGMSRSMVSKEGKRVSFIWGALSILAWILPVLVVVILIDIFHGSALLQIACWAIIPAILIPCIAFSAQRGLRLPWRNILQVLCSWRWWAGVLLACMVGLALPELLHATVSGTSTPAPEEIPLLRAIFTDVFAFGSWTVLMAWVAILIDGTGESIEIIEKDSAPLPLPEPGDGAGRNT